MDILQLTTPVNLPAEADKFFASRTYHPRFAYDWNREEINRWLKRSPQYEPLAQAILRQDAAAITAAGAVLFQVGLSEPLLEAAKSTLDRPLQAVHKPTLDELVNAQQAALDYLNIPYSIMISDNSGFVARPHHKNRQLIISKHVNYHFFSLASSVRHDMTHIIRYLNGKANGIPRSTDYLPTEEGLASFMQDHGGQEPNNSAFQHAAEYAVMAICRQGSLRDAVEYLLSIGFPPKLAWQRAARHKFGFADTSEPGDIMKPAMYFFHEQKIHHLSKHERFRLFVGKICLDDLPRHPDYRGRWSEEQLAEFFF